VRPLCAEAFRGQQPQVHEHHMQRRRVDHGRQLRNPWRTISWVAGHILPTRARPPTVRSDRLRGRNCEAPVSGILPSRSCQLSQFCHESSCPTMPAVEDAVANHHIVELLGGSSRSSRRPHPLVAGSRIAEPADGIVGQSPVLNEVMQRVRRVRAHRHAGLDHR
jgi:hypothetical protein